MLDCSYMSISEALRTHRHIYLKRKNINKYKKSNNGTPVMLDKLFNSFDRKIKGIEIFNKDVKYQYFKELNDIFNFYYEESFKPKISKREAYIHYKATNYLVFKKHGYSISYKEFVKSGMAANYKKKL